MNSISIIGHYGKNKEFLDGQTIKTKIITKEYLKNNDDEKGETKK